MQPKQLVASGLLFVSRLFGQAADSIYVGRLALLEAERAYCGPDPLLNILHL